MFLRVLHATFPALQGPPPGPRSRIWKRNKRPRHRMYAGGAVLSVHDTRGECHVTPRLYRLTQHRPPEKRSGADVSARPRVTHPLCARYASLLGCGHARAYPREHGGEALDLWRLSPVLSGVGPSMSATQRAR